MSKITKLERIDVEDINRFAPKNRVKRCVVGMATGSTRTLSKSKLKVLIRSVPKKAKKDKVVKSLLSHEDIAHHQ